LGLVAIYISEGLGNVLIPLGSALLGAVAGSLTTAKVNRDAEERRATREDERRDEEARREHEKEKEAVAGLLIGYAREMNRAAAMVNASLKGERWPFVTNFAQRIRFDDRIRITPYLNASEEEKLVNAETTVDMLLRAAEWVGPKPFEEGDAKTMAEARTDLETGSKMLRERASELRDELLSDDPVVRIRERIEQMEGRPVGW
jgi:hypothetical protein